MRKRQREEAEELKAFRQKVAKIRTRDDQPLNLNNATKEELEQIPGIGPKTVEAISPYVTVECKTSG